MGRLYLAKIEGVPARAPPCVRDKAVCWLLLSLADPRSVTTQKVQVSVFSEFASRAHDCFREFDE